MGYTKKHKTLVVSGPYYKTQASASFTQTAFDQNFFHYDQRPITSTFAYNGQVKIAGMAYSNLVDDEDSITSLPNNISHLLNKKKKINLLNSIREKAEHLIIRKRYETF